MIFTFVPFASGRFDNKGFDFSRKMKIHFKTVNFEAFAQFKGVESSGLMFSLNLCNFFFRQRSLQCMWHVQTNRKLSRNLWRNSRFDNQLIHEISLNCVGAFLVESKTVTQYIFVL